ncbi:MAG: PEGA domain-containing protein [Calditrichaeota bacterium]|nr:MAG: PEGA domain-containing protein [Calditrichota bacterium]
MKKTLFSTLIFRVSLTSVLFFVLIPPTFAQLAQLNLSGTPQKSADEISAVRDANGRFCAAIQVISDMDGFVYQSYNGIVKVDDQPGRDMVYLQPDERVLEIFKSGYQPLKLILSEYGIQLNSKDVWKIIIKGGPKLGDLLPVTIFITPADAQVSVDGKSVQSGKPVDLSKGNHRLRVSKPGFKTIDKNISVSKTKVVFNETLGEVELEQVVISSSPAQATIFLDGAHKGETDRGLFLYPGEYRLKLTKTGYVEIDKTIAVGAGRNNTFSYTLLKNSGTLNLNITPANAKVLINKEDYSNRSQIELAPGRYKIELSKNGYNPASETVTIERGSAVRKTYNLSAKTGTLQFNVQPLTAQVVLKQNGRTVQSWTGMKYLKNLQIGSYELVCSAAGFATETKQITITEGRAEVVDVKLNKPAGFLKPGRFDAGGNMVFVKGGTFQMGDTFGDGSSDEKPVHTVTVSDFYIGKYEVTQKEYREIMGKNPSRFKGDNLPVEKVNWFDAVKFCNIKSERDGLQKCYAISGKNVTCDFSKNGYRLPTEAEWEYAARGGNQSRGFKYSGSNTAGDVAWYGSNSGKKTHPVGQKQANELGLHDMSGNVWEWCNDWYDSGYYGSSPQSNPRGADSGKYRVLRGGSWYFDAGITRCAYRDWNNPVFTNYSYGFRLSQNVN